MNRRSLRSGFTIVELLIVIVVIAILAAITIVAYNGITRQAIQAQKESDVSTLLNQLELMRQTQGILPSAWGCGLRADPSYAALNLPDSLLKNPSAHDSYPDATNGCQNWYTKSIAGTIGSYESVADLYSAYYDAEDVFYTQYEITHPEDPDGDWTDEQYDTYYDEARAKFFQQHPQFTCVFSEACVSPTEEEIEVPDEWRYKVSYLVPEDQKSGCYSKPTGISIQYYNEVSNVWETKSIGGGVIAQPMC